MIRFCVYYLHSILRTYLAGILWIGPIISLDSLAQIPFEFNHFQEKDGLSNKFIGCFLKDKDGLLWVGTNEGLNYYDGQRFDFFVKNRDGKNCIPNNTIHDLTQDKEGNIWYGTNKGVGFYNKQTASFKNFLHIDGVDIKIVYNVYCDRKGIVWFTTTNGLYAYHKPSKKFTLFKYQDTGSVSKRLFFARRNGILEDPTKYGLWLTTDQGLVYFDISTKSFFHSFNNPKRLPIFKNIPSSAIALLGNNEVIFGSNKNELTVFDVNSFKIKKKIVLKSTRTPVVGKISTIFVDVDQNLWVSTWAYTLFFINAKTGVIHEFSHEKNNPKSVMGNFFWQAFQDANKTIMLGFHGISYTNSKSPLYKLYNLSDQVPSLLQADNWISSFYEDNNSWLVGTFSSGLFRYYPESRKIEKLTRDFTITELIKHNDEVFMVGNEQLRQYDLKKKTEKIVTLPPRLSRPSNALFGVGTQNDSTLWLVGNTKYIARYNSRTRKFDLFDLFENYDAKSVKQLGTQLLIDQKKDIWVFTNSNGFFKFSPSKQQFFSVKNTESVSFELVLAKPSFDSQNNFWIPNFGVGVYRYNLSDGLFTLWSKSEGLGSDFCSSAIVDRQGKVWTSSFSKFSIFNPQKKSFQNLPIPLPVDNTNYKNLLFKLRNGHIISIIKEYLVELIPESIHEVKLTEKPLISRIDVSNNIHIQAIGKKEINLGVGQNDLTISVGYLPMSLNAPYQFAFFLEGQDNTWHSAGTRSFASYSDLPGGDYVFKVKAVYGQYESPISQLRIHIEMPFYQANWFKILCVLSVIGLLVAFIKYRTTQQQKIYHLQIQSTRLEKDKTEIQYQNLINHLNPHFLFNSLTSLNSLILTEPKTASKFLQKLSAIYRYILQSKDKEVVTLEQELNFVKHYIDLQKSRFEEGIDIRIDVPTDYLSSRIVPVTLQNLLENAIKHNTIDEEQPLVINVLVEGEYLAVKNNLQKKNFVETSNKQGLESLKKLYKYLSTNALETIETETEFIVKVPLI